MSSDTLKARVEIPKGSRNKYEYNEETGDIELDRRLFSAVSFPTDYGFIKKTLTEEGEELDALVCVEDPTFPGCVVPVKPIAVFKMHDEDGPDHKILCVPVNDPAWNYHEEVDDLPGNLQDEIAHFFSVYTDIEGQSVEIEGWGDSEEAQKLVEEARRRYSKQTAAE